MFELFMFLPFLSSDDGGGNGGKGEDPQSGGEDNPEDDDKGGGGAEDDKSFTQEEVSAIASKEAKKAKASLLKSLGLNPDEFDADSVKEIIAKKKEQDEANKTELEKAKEQMTAKEKAVAEAEKRALKAESKLTAVSLGVDSKKLDDFITLAEAKVTEDVPLDKAMEKVLETYPDFSGSPKRQSFDPSNPRKKQEEKGGMKNTNPTANRILGYKHKR